VGPLEFAALVAIGLAGGAAGGLFGVGGGIVMVPFVVLLLPATGFHAAKAASLLVVVLAAGVAVLAHHRRGSVDVRRGAALGVSGVMGAFLGAEAAERLPDRVLAIAFGIVLVAIGVRFILGLQPHPHAVSDRTTIVVLAGVGVLAGLLAGFFGIGGGVVMVPALVALGLSMHLAVGTSLVAVAANALSGTITHLTLGYGAALVTLGLPLAIGAVPGSELGARLAHRLPAARLQRAFGVFLIGVGAYLAVRAHIR